MDETKIHQFGEIKICQLDEDIINPLDWNEIQQEDRYDINGVSNGKII